MTSSQIDVEILAIFRAVLRLPDLVLLREMTAPDVPGWTSLTHIRLMVAIEEKFQIRFSAPEVIGFKNYGELLDQVAAKVKSR